VKFRVRVTGLREWQDQLARMAADQIPYATALMLTRLAQDGQAEVRRELPQRFIIRRAAWAEGGVVITPATKSRLVSEVVDRNYYMVLQETGGEKFFFMKDVAIPLEGARSTPQAIVKPSDYPHAVMAQGGFIRKNAQGLAIMYRVARKYQRRGRRGGQKVIGPLNAQRTGDIVPMWLLVKQAEVKPAYQMEETVAAVVDANAERRWLQAADEAIR
jgi:hypothetical protein